ncbi:MAG: ADOP family duplicated permease [Vicinamibacteraceae bacterium]
MATLREWVIRLWGALRPSRGDAELEEELRLHVELAAEHEARRETSVATARRTAAIRSGGVVQAVEALRDQRGLPWLDEVRQNMRHVRRGLRRSPGFVAAAILTLGLGIGANTALFSVVHGVLLKPLPFAEPDRLVGVWHTAPGLGFDRFEQSPATYFTYRDENRVFEDVGLWAPFPQVSITSPGEPERVQALYVTDGTLAILEVEPLLGRLFTKADDTPGSPDRTVLTYGYWQRRFGGAPHIVGRPVTIDGKPHEVIGVLPPSFGFLDTNPAVLLPFRFNRADSVVGSFSYRAVARLKPGITIAQANDDLARMIPLTPERFPPRPGDVTFEEMRLGPNVRRLSEDVIGEVARMLWILLGTVGIVLLIACANVANLFLVRAEGRRQELAVRAALGASRGGLARELLAESVTLGLAGGLLGLLLAQAGIRLLVWLAPSGLPRLDEIGLHPVVLLFTLAIAILAGLLFGLVTVVKFGTPSVTALQEGGRSASEGPEQHRARNALVVAQVALALVLLVVSGLMVRTFVAMRQVDPGFTRPEEVQTFRVAIPEALVANPQQTVRTHEQIAERLRQLPGVESVGLASSVTMDGFYFNGSILVEEFPEADARVRPFRRHKFIAPGYFETLGNRVLIGRTITWRDIYQDALVVVVSEHLAGEYWTNPADAIGKRIHLTPTEPWREIIGIVGNERDDGLNQPAPAIVYWPMAMTVDETLLTRTMSYAVRSARMHTPGFFGELQQAVWSVNASLALGDVQTLDHIRSASMAQTSFALTMLVIAAAVALLLGIVGLYGVIAYIATQRTREIGIRMALGAQRRDVSRLFVRHGLWVTGIGLALGIGAALALSRLISSLLFGVSAADPITYAAVAASLGGIALLATYLPARRAARVDPAVTLRGQ